MRSARAAVLAYFIIVGLTEGIWIARIPGVKARLHLADGLLGASLTAALYIPAGLALCVTGFAYLLDRPVVSEPVLSGTEPGRSAGSRSR